MMCGIGSSGTCWHLPALQVSPRHILVNDNTLPIVISHPKMYVVLLGLEGYIFSIT